ncbi:MAG: hypothetical protein AAGA56_12190 [Myxococcota bacterium]
MAWTTAVAVATVACRSPEPREREVERFTTTLNRIAQMPAGTRARALDELGAIRFETPAVVTARATCVKAYRALDDVQRRLLRASPPATDADVAAAEARLREAETAQRRCDASLTALR